jgi:hypothetical protein
MTLGPPPPRRSRRQRLDLGGRRLTFITGSTLILVGVALVWHPWQGPSRRDWTTAPTLPSSSTAAERRWLGDLADWASYVRDAQEDPTTLAVRDCGKRLNALGTVPSRLAATHALAADACGALQAQARDEVSSERSIDAKLAGKAAAEGREGDRDLRLLVGSLGGNDLARGKVEPSLSRIATTLSGRDATVRCFTSGSDWRTVQDAIGRTEHGVVSLAGFALIARRRIDLSPDVCRTLLTIRTARFAAATHAIEVLTHESEHLAGVDGIENEARTDCYAAQRMRITAGLLGRPLAEARAMGGFYLRVQQPSLPAEYRSAECRNGGAYDLRPQDQAFP